MDNASLLLGWGEKNGSSCWVSGGCCSAGGSLEKSFCGSIIFEPCLHLKDFCYCLRMRQCYWFVKVLWTVVTVVVVGRGECCGIFKRSITQESTDVSCVLFHCMASNFSAWHFWSSMWSCLNCSSCSVLHIVDSVLFVPWSWGLTRWWREQRFLFA